MNIREAISRLNPYEKWKPLRQLSTSPQQLWSTAHSAGVFEMSSDVIKKVYDPTNKIHNVSFANERRILDFLTRQGSSITPKLLYVDEKNTTLYMTHCGQTPKPPTATTAVGPQLQTDVAVAEAKKATAAKSKFDKKLAQEVDKLMRQLESKYGVAYKPNIGKKQLYSYPLHQVAKRNGKMFILDFHDSKLWSIVPPTGGGSPIQDNDPIVPLPVDTPTKSQATLPFNSNAPIATVSGKK